MKEKILIDTLIAAQSGDMLIREELIRSHKAFISRVSSKICNRYLTWDNDDELSIALIAFNDAIDTFDPDGGASFYSFVHMVIHRRLVDYFRKEGKHQHLSLSPMNPEDEELSRYDSNTSQFQYQEIENTAVFAEVVENYVHVLSDYNVTLDDLVKVSPKHRDSKETLLRVVLALSSEPNLMTHLKIHRLLPIKELELLTGVKRKVLEKGRKYLIALALVLYEPEFHPLKNFMQIPTEPEE
ncbi:RNA polymerase sigma-I factor [Desulfosporosinus fructosivorans]|uniref:RNA polymerase sigma factor SigI n=1 Tax=Desulfosporosinus fructosivorans TaxID=2018669 RepID=A0A4Z0R6L1_9FIRM|nr:RNA polymerase sigma-I factor [Desulfosporosinus fructosivorans]TGE37296.1 RNA polymerase sigma-I factor [Desulfosporosinus fructosivorans]